MIEVKFRGVGKEVGILDVCNCTCYTGGRDQSAKHQRDNNPTCKCTCHCDAHKSKTQRKDDTSQDSYEAGSV